MVVFAQRCSLFRVTVMCSVWHVYMLICMCMSVGEVSVSDLLLFLLHVLLSLSSQQAPPTRAATTPPIPSLHQQPGPQPEDYSPVAIITHFFEEIITGNLLSQQLFCNVC